VAIEYPVLAILASIFFMTIVFSSLYLYLYIVSEVNRIPVVSGYAQLEDIVGDGWRINITIRHERGEIVNLKRIQLVTESGVITIESFPYSSNNITVKLIGFRDTTLMPGSVGLIVIELLQNYFEYNKTYSGLIVFDKGTLVVTYTTPPPT
jgi:hypothetical protein